MASVNKQTTVEGGKNGLGTYINLCKIQLRTISGNYVTHDGNAKKHTVRITPDRLLIVTRSIIHSYCETSLREQRWFCFKRIFHMVFFSVIKHPLTKLPPHLNHSFRKKKKDGGVARGLVILLL